MLPLGVRSHFRPVIGTIVSAELYQCIVSQTPLSKKFLQTAKAFHHRRAEAAVVVQLYPGLLLQPYELVLAAAVAAVLLHHAGHYGISKYTQLHSGPLLFVI